MPFCVIPKKIAEIILTKRVVTNEHNVLEFACEPSHSGSRLSTMGNRYSKRASALMTTSPRAISKSSSDKVLPMNQQPILSNISITNPFLDNQFPVIEFNFGFI